MARFGTQKLYIDGAYVDAGSDATFEAINPATGEVLAHVQRATEADVEKAVESAERGQKVWAAMTAMQAGQFCVQNASVQPPFPLRRRRHFVSASGTNGRPEKRSRQVSRCRT